MNLAVIILIAALLTAPAWAVAGEPTLVPDMETAPSPYPGDSLDDAAVWIHRSDPTQSVIVTTLKASNLRPVQPTGILTYDLSGKQLQFLQGDTPNNIDARRNFPFEHGPDTLFAASHWWSDMIGLYRMDAESRQLKELIKFQTGVEKLRGLCMGHYDDEFYAVAVGSDGDIEQYQINSPTEANLTRHWQLESEAEGCVIDDATQTLYVAEENVGLWQFPLGRPGVPELFAEVGWFSPLKRGLEGLALLEVDTKQHLIVSVQEKNRYAIYDLSGPEPEHLGDFRIGPGNGIDGTSHTDGIHVEPLAGTRFAGGLLIVHDDHNQAMDGSREKQNFKVVALDSLIELIQQQHAQQD
jgi:3-phytase